MRSTLRGSRLAPVVLSSKVLLRCSVVIILFALIDLASTNDAQNHALRGEELQTAGKIHQAVLEYEESVRLDPKEPAVLTNLGAAYAASGDLLKAAESYKRALRVAPGYDPALVNLGLAYYKLNLWSEAAETFRRHRETHPRDLRNDLLLADCELQVSNYKEAIAIAEPLEAAHPDDLALAYVLGTAYLRTKQEDKGMTLVRKIMEKGDTPEVRMMLGDAYTLGNEFKAAAAEYQNAIDKDPKQWLAYLRLAEAQVSMGDFDHAIPNFTFAQEHNPSNFEANYYLGYIYKDHNQPHKAKPYLEKAAALRPDLYQPRFQYAVALMDTSELKKAQSLLERIVREHPGETEAHVVLGRLYLRLKMKPEAAAQMLIVQKQNAAKDAASEHRVSPGSPSLPPQ